MRIITLTILCIFVLCTLPVYAEGCDIPPLERDCANRAVAVEWSHDGALFAVAWRNAITIFDATTYTIADRVDGVNGVLSIQWHPSALKLAITEMDEPTTSLISIVDLETDERVTSTGFFFTTPVMWSPDGTMLAVGNIEGQVFIFDSTLEEPIYIFEENDEAFTQGANTATAVCWSDDGQSLVTLFFGINYVFELEQNDIVASNTIGGRSGACNSDATVIVTSSLDYINTSEGQQNGYFTSVSWLPAFSVSWSPDNERIAINVERGSVYIYDASTGILQATLLGGMLEHLGWINEYNDSLAWSPDGSMLAEAGQDGLVRIWDTETYELIQTLSFEEEE